MAKIYIVATQGFDSDWDHIVGYTPLAAYFVKDDAVARARRELDVWIGRMNPVEPSIEWQRNEDEHQEIVCKYWGFPLRNERYGRSSHQDTERGCAVLEVELL